MVRPTSNTLPSRVLSTSGVVVAVVGGYDGETSTPLVHFIPQPSLDILDTLIVPADEVNEVGAEKPTLSSTPRPPSSQPPSSQPTPPSSNVVQHTWAPTTPLTWSDIVADVTLAEDVQEIEDMDDEDDNDDLASERYRLLHRVACARGYRQYVDPGSGYTVFTALYLKDRACCGYKCRHCPWGHKNVKKGVKNPNPNLEW
ncbi:hypothetical protein AaE_009597 [Aphanomyces astaci]|uniref:Uncharacterized protein n=1 Tax=Aphanomyces astaci TaxID=112090 RepID=A0A6A5A7A3_APHAT|nr:hypothetical protein AaE_009597 [Aphanomyces astaci]